MGLSRISDGLAARGENFPACDGTSSKKPLCPLMAFAYSSRWHWKPQQGLYSLKERLKISSVAKFESW